MQDADVDEGLKNPAGRGEHELAQFANGGGHGSSPRAWGTREQRMGGHRRHGFIPTGVGNTPTVAPSWTELPVHPHGRGEHRKIAALLHKSGGSSPRAWGTLS